MQPRILLFAQGLAIAALAMGLGGCVGKPQYDVSGKVKYNGSPLDKPNGQIIFVGPDGKQVAAQIAPDGSYSAPKVSGGVNKVAVYYSNPSFGKVARPRGEPDPKFRPPTVSPYITPEQYASVDTSGLTIQVAQGTVFDVDMTGPKIP
jgi:hypothetical protein